MRIFIILSLMIIFLVKCSNVKEVAQEHGFRCLDFTYNDVFSTCFSIKFTKSDTAFIHQHFARSNSGNLKGNTSYYTLLSKNDELKLDSFLHAIPFSIYDSSYYQGYEDGIDYQFYIENDSINKLIRVHSQTAPFPLDYFKNWIIEKKKDFLLNELDTNIYFKSEKFVVPPPILPR